MNGVLYRETIDKLLTQRRARGNLARRNMLLTELCQFPELLLGYSVSVQV